MVRRSPTEMPVAGALNGVKVVDLSRGMATAAAGMILADNGAEAIKGAAFLCDIGLLAALYQQRLTGRGQHVQTSLEEGIAVLSTGRWLLGDALPDIPHVTSTSLGRGQRAVVGQFQCQDGAWLYIHTM